MLEQEIRPYLGLTKFFAVALAFIALYHVMPKLVPIGVLSDDYVEEVLYGHIDNLNEELATDRDLASIVLAADIDPFQLTLADRQRLVDYERQFYDSWEIAWSYHNESVLNGKTWNKWNSWFVTEAQLRPQLGWIENREHFKEDFVWHVDSSLAAD